jgi:hypothetical protein
MNRAFLISAILVVLAASPAAFAGQEEPPPPVRPPHRILLQVNQLDPEQISSVDRQVLTSRQTQLNAAQIAAGYDISEGMWKYQQAVCPVFPGTILLHYESDAGTTHASRFVAVVPRGETAVRIVPVLRGGNTPFKSAYKNANTIAVFNETMTREGVKVDGSEMSEHDEWVNLALCYAEMTGEHPTTLLTDTLYGEAYERNVNMPVRRIQSEASFLDPSKTGYSYLLEFSDVNDPKATVQWDLLFDRTGSLKEVSREPRPLNTPLRTLTTQTDLVPAQQAPTP